MAYLEFKAGAITSRITVANVKANTVFKNFAKEYQFHIPVEDGGYGGNIDDDQAVADFVMRLLQDHLTRGSRRYKTTDAVEEAQKNVAKDRSIDFKD